MFLVKIWLQFVLNKNWFLRRAKICEEVQRRAALPPIYVWLKTYIVANSRKKIQVSYRVSVSKRK